MSSSGRYEPHRGTLILVLGIISMVTAGLIIGPIAWFLGTADMKKIRAGTMDPEGESMTNIGRILGLVAFFLNVAACCVIIIVYGALGAFFFANKDEFQKAIEKMDKNRPQAPQNAPPKDDFEFKLPEDRK